jgi:hypothetical protein
MVTRGRISLSRSIEAKLASPTLMIQRFSMLVLLLIALREGQDAQKREGPATSALIWHSIGFADGTLGSFAQPISGNSISGTQHRPLALTKWPF